MKNLFRRNKAEVVPTETLTGTQEKSNAPKLTGIKRFQETAKNRRGYTLLQIVLIAAFLIALVALTNPIELIQKTLKGRATTAWITDLNGVSNAVSTGKTKSDFMFGVTARSGDGNYEITLPAPPASASKVVNAQRISATEGFTYGTGGAISYTPPTGVTGVTLAGYATTTPAATVTIKSLTQSGANGITPFLNKALPDVEKNVFLGLLGGQDTKLGKEIVKSKKATSLTGTPTAAKILDTIFGDVAGAYNYETSDVMDRWFNLVPMDQDAIRKISDTKSRFTDKGKYRLYYVSRVNTKDEAIALFTGDTTPAQIALLDELYETATKSLRESDIVVMPVTKSEMVFSENSEFKLPKFSSND